MHDVCVYYWRMRRNLHPNPLPVSPPSHPPPLLFFSPIVVKRMATIEGKNLIENEIKLYTAFFEMFLYENTLFCRSCINGNALKC